MRRRNAFVLCLVLAAATMAAAEDAPPAEPPVTDTVAYTIGVELDPANHTLLGTETILWRNTTAVPAPELRLHLYLNAFASDRTTFMKESGGTALRSPEPVDDWGWTRITRLELADGADLLPSLEFVQPDDGNPDDRTVARIALPEAVPPGGAVTVELAFEARLPRVIARTGWAGDFHMVGQWFPKLGVFGPAGWNCHQFHANSEFFSDFGSYRVTVTVPEGWKVAGTGTIAADETVAAGDVRERRVTFEAERVHDFAWAAAPGTVVRIVEGEFDPARDVPGPWLEAAARALGVSPAELDLPPTHLRLMIPNDQAAIAQRQLRAARLAIAWYGLHYGPYPYPQLTIVSPPVAAMEAGGMEYPTLITTGGSRWLKYPPLEWTPFVDTVVVHEFGHQYFYGMLASNEFEQAWLDEGLNSYAEAACMTAIQHDGLVPELRRWPGDPWTTDRVGLEELPLPLTVDTFAWKFRTRSDYFAASYGRTAVALHTLEGLVGADRFARAMRAYALGWRFRHPTGADFRRALEASLGEDLGWFFSQAIEGDAVPDWAVLSVEQRRAGVLRGWEWRDGAWHEAPETGGDGDDPDRDEAGGGTEEEPWTVRVDVGRRGDFRGPVEVEFRWDDGTVERRSWDGKDRWTRWRFEGGRRLDAVIVDPDGHWALETRRADNYWRRKPDRGAVHRRFWWTAEIVRALAGLLAPWS